MTFQDPTAFDLNSYVETGYGDPRQVRIQAYTSHGHYYVDVPFMTEVAPNLWHGGVETGLLLPDFIEYKLSLYPWEDYTLTDTSKLKESRAVEMYDSTEQTFEQIRELADWVSDRRQLGPVFVHCQAGLNRSSLVVAQSLVDLGDVMNGEEAIELIRSKRHIACLCNPAFDAYVRTM